MPKKILFIFIFGLALRLIYVLFVPQMDVAIGDSNAYTTIGRNLAVHQDYTYKDERPDVYWAPGYPFFISIIYKIFGVNNTAVRIIQSILSALVILFMYLICKKMFNPKVAMITAIVTSIYPGFIGYSGLLLPQLLAMFLISLFILIRVHFQLSIFTAFILGSIAGYSSLTRSELVLFWSILFFAMLFMDRAKRQNIKFIIVALIVMFSIISVWSVRNYKIFGKLIPISIHYGDTIWISTWHEEWLEWHQEEPFISLGKGKDSVESARIYLKSGIANIKEHPYKYLLMCLKRLYRFWLTGHSNIFYFMKDSLINYLFKKSYGIFFIKAIMLFFNMSIILSGFIGIKIAYTKFAYHRNIMWYILSPVLFFVILHFFTFSTPRYAMPIMPFVIIFSSCSLVYFYDLIRHRDAIL